jgi:hypothetical protein
MFKIKFTHFSKYYHYPKLQDLTLNRANVIPNSDS